MIIIDSRERALILACQAQNISFETQQLSLGDIAIGVEWLIERKTIGDLAASIVDGRFEEQRSRLRLVPPPTKIGYLIEGSPSYSQLKGGVVAALTSIGIEFKIFISDSPETSAHVISKLIKGQCAPKSQVSCFQSQATKVNRIKIEDARTMLKVALMNVPGIGPKSAEEFCLKFESINDLINSTNHYKDKKTSQILKLFGCSVVQKETETNKYVDK